MLIGRVGRLASSARRRRPWARCWRCCRLKRGITERAVYTWPDDASDDDSSYEDDLVPYLLSLRQTRLGQRLLLLIQVDRLPKVPMDDDTFARVVAYATATRYLWRGLQTLET